METGVEVWKMEVVVEVGREQKVGFETPRRRAVEILPAYPAKRWLRWLGR
jgi:hypothetical protein